MNRLVRLVPIMTSNYKIGNSNFSNNLGFLMNKWANLIDSKDNRGFKDFKDFKHKVKVKVKEVAIPFKMNLCNNPSRDLCINKTHKILMCKIKVGSINNFLI